MKTHGGILKISPLADWSQEDVWQYIRDNDVPYNRLLTTKVFPVSGAPLAPAP